MPNTQNNEFVDVVDLTTSDRHSLSTSSMPSTKHPDCIVVRQKRRSYTAEERLAFVGEKRMKRCIGVHLTQNQYQHWF